MVYAVPSDKKVKVGVLGATGTVGQRFIALLEHHPYFVVHVVGASVRSAGKSYAAGTSWKQTTPIPAGVRELIIRPCEPEHFQDCTVVFSGLDADAAGDIGACVQYLDDQIYTKPTKQTQRLPSARPSLLSSPMPNPIAEITTCP